MFLYDFRVGVASVQTDHRLSCLMNTSCKTLFLKKNLKND